MNKKAISPLIATVLLIGFTIALAVIVTNWGLNYVKGTTDRTSQQTEEALSCINNLDFEITDVSCEDNTITVDNKGSNTIEALTFRIHAGGDVLPIGTEGMPAFGIKTYAGTDYDFDLIGGTKVEAIANISINGKEVTCSQVVKERKFECLAAVE
ncbi:MAG TPA: archaellin/type IV pilin N-terminal domain-containing protein [Candidatus Nanoarchaeia archaeon]|nr:archaellin/type IV pilin N-terminal domain-containing protein [Candidatus Nanoarchaeia archaeon]